MVVTDNHRQRFLQKQQRLLRNIKFTAERNWSVLWGATRRVAVGSISVTTQASSARKLYFTTNPKGLSLRFTPQTNAVAIE